jgi:hypothetical protein
VVHRKSANVDCDRSLALHSSVFQRSGDRFASRKRVKPKIQGRVPIPSERKRLQASASEGDPAHLLQPSSTIFPVEHVDERPHDMITEPRYNTIVSGLLPRTRKWLRARRGILHAVRGDEIPSRCGDCYASYASDCSSGLIASRPVPVQSNLGSIRLDLALGFTLPTVLKSGECTSRFSLACTKP